MATIEELFLEDPQAWIEVLPNYQQQLARHLLQSANDYSGIAEKWLTASAENTFNMSASSSVGDKSAFLKSLKKELKAFLCGDEKYEADRSKLFGGVTVARNAVVSGAALAVAPHVGVAAVAIVPVVTFIFASFGRVALNAWCSMEE